METSYMFTWVGLLLGSAGAKNLSLSKESIAMAMDDARKLIDLGPPSPGGVYTGEHVRNFIDVNIQDLEGNSPLHHAVVNGKKKEVELLLLYQPNLSLLNKKGETAYQRAIRNGWGDEWVAWE